MRPNSAGEFGRTLGGVRTHHQETLQWGASYFGLIAGPNMRLGKVTEEYIPIVISVLLDFLALDVD